MRAVVGAGERGQLLSATALLAAMGAVGLSVVRPSALFIGVPLAIAIPFAYAHRWFFAWHRLLAMLILIILFIPIKRYGIPGNVPFDLEPYRIFVGLTIFGWFVSLLIDGRVRVRKTGIEGPIALIAIASLLSDVVNGARIHQLEVQPEVTKGLMFLGTFFLICYLIVSVTKTRAQVERLVEVLCAGGGVVGNSDQVLP